MLIPGYQPETEPALLVPRMGLVRSATEVITSDERWIGGFGYTPQSCEAAQAIPLFCDPGDYESGDYTKVAGDNPAPVEYQPFVVIGRDSCSTLDRDRDRTGRARQQLLATESYQIAREFWRGDLAREGSWPNRYLTNETDATDLGTAGATQALAALEFALGECLHGQRGMIHATTYTASIWQALGLLREDQGILTTALGTIVVADAGYDGSAPGLSTPTPVTDIDDAASAYGTGLVYLRRGTIAEVGDLASQIDRSVNDWTVFVERPVAALYDGCCLITILVDHTTSGVDTNGGVDGGGA